MPNQKTVSKVKPSAPPSRPVKYDWAAIADQLREDPGEWFLIFENGPASTAGAVRAGHMVALPPEEFEVQTSNNVRTSPRTCTMHMRYVKPKRKGRK